MLRTQHDGDIWFVTQPDHAAVAAYLAAHWGNDEFCRPGFFSPAADADRLRGEVIFAIAQHDNGWWEWEATPELADADKLPLDLAGVLRNRQAGMERWRRGIPRFSAGHPYAALLISWHAYWLYTPSIDPACDTEFWHPLFRKDQPPEIPDNEVDETRQFVAELEEMQSGLMARLTADPETKDWVAADHLKPHVRLLQLLDGISLSLCSALVPALDGEAKGRGVDTVSMTDIARSRWDDRVTICAGPAGDRCIRMTPYPFDTDPLPVFVPTRILPAVDSEPRPFPVRWHARAPSLIRYEFRSE